MNLEWILSALVIFIIGVISLLFSYKIGGFVIFVSLIVLFGGIFLKSYRHPHRWKKQ